LTYCVAIKVAEGLVFASDSRTNAGVDQVSTYSKMHTFGVDAERMLCILASGNLATTQAVLRQLRRDVADPGSTFHRAANMSELADHVGAVSSAEQRKHRAHRSEKFNPEASFIVGGQIAGEEHQIFLVYPPGNYIRATAETPYLQIGELKYGKPILDRIVSDELPIELAARCALVSMDSTLRSNATVGPPIELIAYGVDSLTVPSRLVLRDESDYLRQLRVAWQEALKRAFESLPDVPATRPQVRLIDARGDP